MEPRVRTRRRVSLYLDPVDLCRSAAVFRQAPFLMPTTSLLQLLLGIATLLSVVSLPLAVLHQAGAILLFSSAILARHACRWPFGILCFYKFNFLSCDRLAKRSFLSNIGNFIDEYFNIQFEWRTLFSISPILCRNRNDDVESHWETTIFFPCYLELLIFGY